MMPFNRIIHSNGEVIRYGENSLEKHALAVAVLTNNGKLLIEDRLGIIMVINTKNK